jgi:hypothetical protein
VTEAEVVALLRDGTFDLDIPKFKKYNPRETPGWFRLQNDWFLDPKLITLPVTARLLYVTCLSLRASCGGVVVGCTSPGLQLRVGCARRDVRVDLLSLWKKGLISLRTYEQTDKQTDGDGEVVLKAPPPPSIQILEGLENVDDEALQQIPIAAQRSWVKRFGIETVRELVPTAHAAWKNETPRAFGGRTPLATKILRYLEGATRYGPRVAKQKTWEQLLEDERKRKEEEPDAEAGI